MTEEKCGKTLDTTNGTVIRCGLYKGHPAQHMEVVYWYD